MSYWKKSTNGAWESLLSRPNEVDVIICGGGAAGCVVAGRLAAADPSLEIMVVESGINNYNHPSVVRPGVFLSNIQPGSNTAKFYTTNESKHCANRNIVVPAANVLGGGSSINFLVYTRASASDYDDWNTEGWSAKDLIPLLKKTETYHLHKHADRILPFDDTTHGSSGPIQVSYGGHRQTTIMEQFMEACEARGYSVDNEMQDLKSCNGAAHWGKWIDPDTGRRQDSAHLFLHPSKGNIHLLCESRVARVVVEDGKAIGIEYVPTKAPVNGEKSPPHTFIRARKLVILSSGSLGTPGILERSGIGNPTVLRKAGIEPLVDLPGVGEKYQDHNLIMPAYRVTPGTDTHDEINRGDPEAHKLAAEEFVNGKGKYASNFVDVVLKCRPNEKELEELGPAFRKVWDSYFKNAPDKPVICIIVVNSLVGDYSLVPHGDWLTMCQIIGYPSSRGFIHIKSSSPYNDPEFDPGYFSHEADIKVMAWGYRLGREFARRMSCVVGEEPLFHPKFAQDSKAKCSELPTAINGDANKTKESLTAGIAPVSVEPIKLNGNSMSKPKIALQENGSKNITDLEYSADDNAAVEQYLRETVGTAWHALGTTPMKPREQGGVVDKDLNVYGVTNLKIIDLGICPGNVGANTYSTALLVGEKGAVLAGEFLGLKNV